MCGRLVGVINQSALTEQAELTGERVLLRQLTEDYFDAYLPMLRVPESLRLTGSHGAITDEQTRNWLATREGQDDRADWAIVSSEDGAFLGEAVLNELSVPNESMNFRILLAGPHVFDHGYGTEATGLVVDYGLDVVGLHRISLGAYMFNPRALRVYEKCGFVREGVSRDALRADDEWHDQVDMAILATDPRPLSAAASAAPRAHRAPHPRSRT
jgi:RimJ/RimL family protein N-acetyltransferase